ncbi:hypothetical protein DL96DRAFT_1695021 [Flagelloscypha sp. PMI_526]|nr:hypothetical protein DL96DRAFT_1695021 [Flagelloscypha sp. PMI_526]
MDNLLVPHDLNLEEKTAILNHVNNSRGVRGERMRFLEFSLPGRPPLFIKYCEDTQSEASTQHFFHLLASGDESAPRVPKVIDVFSSLIVMEKVDAPTLKDCDISEQEAVDYAASAVKWPFSQLLLIPEGLFGRISSKASPVWHTFFKDHRAPRVFITREELAQYVLKGNRRCREGGRPFRTDTPIEELLTSFGENRIYHSDIKKENFLLDSGRVCIVNFQHVGVFPEVFQTFAFFNFGNSFAASVGKSLGYQPSIIADKMVRVSNVLHQCSGIANLGVNSSKVIRI